MSPKFAITNLKRILTFSEQWGKRRDAAALRKAIQSIGLESELLAACRSLRYQCYRTHAVNVSLHECIGCWGQSISPFPVEHGPGCPVGAAEEVIGKAEGKT